ncbi:hypothetical protein AAT19DRAFT_9195 [Rhodotorula toruloides]|uniref:Uncharacterized protein n=1 Tax=Rhodotorula toruloides TaxID=5286 RepID=A0A2T0AJE0_RHOTO|nr:hypothetical protein AAT19DRAFT_9195 [Rhodotorula toruloides]
MTTSERSYTSGDDENPSDSFLHPPSQIKPSEARESLTAPSSLRRLLLLRRLARLRGGRLLDLLSLRLRLRLRGRGRGASLDARLGGLAFDGAGRGSPLLPLLLVGVALHVKVEALAVEVLDAALDLILARDELDEDVVLDVEGLAVGIDALGAEVGGKRLFAMALLPHLEGLGLGEELLADRLEVVDRLVRVKDSFERKRRKVRAVEGREHFPHHAGREHPVDLGELAAVDVVPEGREDAAAGFLEGHGETSSAVVAVVEAGGAGPAWESVAGLYGTVGVACKR